jgi:hypothetical protein
MRYRLSSLFFAVTAVAFVIGGITAGWRWGIAHTPKPQSAWDFASVFFARYNVYPWCGTVAGMMLALVILASIHFLIELSRHYWRSRRMRRDRAIAADAVARKHQ